jgi:hypothetical protein
LSSLLACDLLFPTRLEATPDASALDARPTGDASVDGPTPDAASDARRPSDATLDSGRPETSAEASVCVHALPPPPPSTTTGQGVLSFVVALRTLTGFTALDASALPALGFDLDGVCTCEPASDPGPGSCVPPTTPAPVDCDQPGGRDLQGDQLLEAFDEAFANTLEGDLLARIAEGRFTVLFDVQGYNGLPDDGQVSVAAYAASGLDTGDAGGAPKWDGTDQWWVDPRSVAAPVPVDGGYQYVPVFVTETAYVTQGVLVAQLGMMDFELGFGIVPLRDVVLAATIAPDGRGGYNLSGQFGARFKTSDAFALIGRVKNLDGGAPLCGSNPEFLAIRNTVCQTADIMSSAALDNMGMTCDSFSIGAGFEAVGARFGPELAPAEYEAGCDGAIDDCTE